MVPAQDDDLSRYVLLPQSVLRVHRGRGDGPRFRPRSGELTKRELLSEYRALWAELIPGKHLLKEANKAGSPDGRLLLEGYFGTYLRQEPSVGRAFMPTYHVYARLTG
jgi:hypothetical protein